MSDNVIQRLSDHKKIVTCNVCGKPVNDPSLPEYVAVTTCPYCIRNADFSEISDAWKPIKDAPRDGRDILGWREDCGTFIMRFCSAVEFMTSDEIESSEMDEDGLHEPDWFAADFIQGSRLEGDEVPNIWTTLPEPRHINE